MKCKVLCFLLCVLFCFFSLSLSSSAVGDDFSGEGLISHQDLIDMGFQYDPSDDTYFQLEGTDSPMFFSGTYGTTKLYPDFDPAVDLPWSDMPQYIQDIAFNTDIDFAYKDNAKVPFIFINYNGDRAWILAGYNLGVGYSMNSGTLCVAGITSAGNSVVNQNQVAYFAMYKENSSGDFELSQDWAVRSGSAWGDNGKVNAFSGNILGGVTYDNYFYGANCVKFSSEYVFSTVQYNASDTSDTDTNAFPIFFSHNRAGMASGQFYWPGATDTSIYCGYFKPQTIEEEERETQKGIWETLKSIPEMIAEKFKGLFIPEEGFFDTYTQEFQDYFKDRFGLLYELPDSVLNILQQFVDFQPAEEGYYINFPEVVMPVLDGGEWSDVVLIEETQVKFEFLNEGPIATLYSLYRSALWLLFIFLLINLIIRKAEKVFGGGSG